MAVAQIPKNRGVTNTFGGILPSLVGGGKTAFGSGGAKTPTTTSTTNTTNNTTGSSTQKDQGTITQKTLVPEWAQQGNQDQYNNAVSNNGQATDFYSSILGGTNGAADLWANQQLKKMMQQMTSAPGFTETGAAAQGIAGSEALAAIQSMMMDRMFQASQGIQGVGQNTIPFLQNAGAWADQQENRDLTSTRNWSETGTGSSTTTNQIKGGGGGTRSTSVMQGGASGASGAIGGNGYIGPMYNYGGGLGALPGLMAQNPTGVHPNYAAFLKGANSGAYGELQRQRLI